MSWEKLVEWARKTVARGGEFVPPSYVSDVYTMKFAVDVMAGQAEIDRLRSKAKLSEGERFTRDEVAASLCDACRLHVPERYDLTVRKWEHCLNGLVIPCGASDWRAAMADADWRKEHSLKEGEGQ